jgi:hypothetical protein
LNKVTNKGATSVPDDSHFAWIPVAAGVVSVVVVSSFLQELNKVAVTANIAITNAIFFMSFNWFDFVEGEGSKQMKMMLPNGNFLSPDIIYFTLQIILSHLFLMIYESKLSSDLSFFMSCGC